MEPGGHRPNGPPSGGPPPMPSRWPQPPRIVVLTGPALSREAGFAPCDPARMPPGVGIADFVTREASARDPAPVHAFYNERRRQLLETVTPNAVHDGLAALDIVRRNEVPPTGILIVTRNIDDLHERVGAHAVIHKHGAFVKARFLIFTRVSD